MNTEAVQQSTPGESGDADKATKRGLKKEPEISGSMLHAFRYFSQTSPGTALYAAQAAAR
ncbi:MAG: hypothetical protein AAF402_06260 [Pseudomonadota bacterium]